MEQKHLAKGFKDPLIWIDLEMTGLEIKTEFIIEIAVIVTDGSLSQIIEGPNLVINCSDEVLNNMNEWCIKQHNASGLVQKVKDSKLTLQEAERQVLDFLTLECGLKSFTCQLGGNSVSVDRQFIQKDMPNLYKFLHYRIVDVSTIKEICKRWIPSLPPFQKKECHRAMDDIRESIEELKFYKTHVFGFAITHYEQKKDQEQEQAKQ